MKDFEISVNLSKVNENKKKSVYIKIDELSKEEESMLIEQNYKLFLEFSKLYKTNELLKNKLQELISEKNKLKAIINKLEKEENKIEIKDLYTQRKVI
jgi:hypothetical protein